MRHKAYLAGKKLPAMYAKPFEEIQFFPERLEQPLHWKKPQTIFVGSQTDLFHEKVPFEYVHKIFDITQKAYQHQYLFLTKRPDRMKLFIKECAQHNKSGDRIKKSGIRYHSDFAWPHSNVSLGLTICNQQEADEKIPILLQTPAAKRWLSIEPMLEEIDIEKWLWVDRNTDNDLDVYGQLIDWVVVGCESGPHARQCLLANIESIVDQCDAAGVRMFVKQVNLPKEFGMELTCKSFDAASKAYGFRVSHNPAEWPEKLQRRQLS